MASVFQQRPAHPMNATPGSAGTSNISMSANSDTALSKLESEWKERIHSKLLTVMDLSLIGSMEGLEARKQIRDICQRLMQDESALLNADQRTRVIQRIEDEVLGLGPLESLLQDPTISDILVNGANQVYVERRGKLELTNVTFNDDRHLMNIIDRIVSGVGRRIDESSPMVDARLQDGSRVNAIIPPLALDGPILSIRRFSAEMLTMEKLIELGSVSKQIAVVLEAIVVGRLNILVSGGTGAGKTTMLNVLSGYIPTDERIVTIEDSAELQLQQPHVVRLETRPPNIENKGEITARDLIKNSLRMRPERIIIGEVRGAEALDMLQAMNTGHDGSLTTIHANTPRDALSRVETMVSMTGISFPMKTLRAQIASAINVVIQIERHEDGHRRLTSVQEIDGMEGDIITMSELFAFERQGLDEEGNVLGSLRATGVVPSFRKKLHLKGIEIPVETFEPSWLDVKG
ncbi:MAG: CpaF family protein [Gammaproteobacteria bacterium]|nr:MAG: CpaF family protein [Gammaproteobacteria bacterium]TDJ43478.1 MAG: CpaF family protein [Gammaproteobacteria bacterium]